MFESLSDKLKKTLKNLRGQGTLTPEHVDAALAAFAITLTKDEIAKIDAAYRPRPAAGHGI